MTSEELQNATQIKKLLEKMQSYREQLCSYDKFGLYKIEITRKSQSLNDDTSFGITDTDIINRLGDDLKDLLDQRIVELKIQFEML